MYIVEYCEKGNVVVCIVIVKFKKISNLSSPPTPQKGLEVPGGLGGGAQRANHFKKSMKANWNFQRGDGGVRENSFCAGRYGY